MLTHGLSDQGANGLPRLSPPYKGQLSLVWGRDYLMNSEQLHGGFVGRFPPTQEATRILKDGPGRQQMPGILPRCGTPAKRMWVDPSWSVQALGLPQTPVAEAFRDAVSRFAAHGHIGAQSR